MATRLSALVVALVLAGGFTIGAQQSESARELTVEELYLQNIEFQIMKERAFSADRELKYQVLDDLEEMIQDGTAEEDQVSFILEYLALEGISIRIREGSRLVNDFPDVRREATYLLGQLGGEQAKDALLTILLKDEDPIVRAEAAFSLGTVGLLGSESEVVDALVYSIDIMDPSAPDNSYAWAVLSAFEKLAEANNGIPEADVYRALVQIAQGNYFRRVRDRATQILSDMRRF